MIRGGANYSFGGIYVVAESNLTQCNFWFFVLIVSDCYAFCLILCWLCDFIFCLGYCQLDKVCFVLTVVTWIRVQCHMFWPFSQLSGDGASGIVSQSMLSDDCEDIVRIEWMDHQLLGIIPTMPTSRIRWCFGWVFFSFYLCIALTLQLLGHP